MFILLDALKHLPLEMIRPPTSFVSSPLPDIESTAHGMEVFGLLREVSARSQLNPAYVNHLQSLTPLDRLDVAVEGIKECLVGVDHMSFRAQSRFVVLLEIAQREKLRFMVLPHSPGMVREYGNVPEMAEAGISMSDAKLAPTDVPMCVSSVACALLVARGYRIVCCFAGRYQSHPEKIPSLSESVPSLHSDTTLDGIVLDVFDLFLYPSQKVETLGIWGGHGDGCFANGQPAVFEWFGVALGLYNCTER